MKIIVHVQGNSEKTFASINEALSFARLQVYATQATIIRAFDALQDGNLAQWNYGFSSVAVYPQN
jgi:hypothetical protein